MSEERVELRSTVFDHTSSEILVSMHCMVKRRRGRSRSVGMFPFKRAFMVWCETIYPILSITT